MSSSSRTTFRRWIVTIALLIVWIRLVFESKGWMQHVSIPTADIRSHQQMISSSFVWNNNNSNINNDSGTNRTSLSSSDSSDNYDISRYQQHAATTTPSFRYSSNNNNNQSMAACLLVRNDNQLLYEWVAYHYMVLPLRYLIVGNDENATEDPREVLQRWNRTTNTDLQYQVWTFGVEYGKRMRYPYENRGHRYQLRQRKFLSRCLTYCYRRLNRTWVALIDSDEYIQLNPLNHVENQQYYKKDQSSSSSSTTPPYPFQGELWKKYMTYLSPNETLWDRIQERKNLRQELGMEAASNSRRNNNNNVDDGNTTTAGVTGTGVVVRTVMEVLEEYSSRHGTLPCHTMPRLRFSAVTDNYTTIASQKCIPPLDMMTAVSSPLNVTQLSTIQYLYHANPYGFEHNTWSKVLMDVSRLHGDFHVNNPHLPNEQYCGGNLISPSISLFRVHHYVASLLRPGGRRDDARDENVTAMTWSNVAHVRHDVTCDHMYAWLNAFCNQFGMETATYLLGLPE